VTRRDILTAASFTVGLAALIARAVASALADIEFALSAYTVEVPAVVPLWMDEEADL
jgi:hypothetical protein